MSKRVLFVLLNVITLCLSAQNTWINYAQSYYKIPIFQDGIYRISYQQLIAAGINVNAIDARNFQLFFKGKEIPLYVQGEQNVILSTGDFIEFYAEKNTGELDEKLFAHPLDQGNPYVSLFNDTIHCFLTWNNLTNNKRFTVETDVSFVGYTPMEYYWKAVKLVHQQSFSNGQQTFFGWSVPEYSSGEGYLSTNVNYGQSRSYNLDTRFIAPNGPDPILTTRVFGRSRNSRNIRVLVNNTNVLDTSINRFNGVDYRTALPLNLLNEVTTINYVNQTVNQNRVDRFAIAFTAITYPSQFNAANANALTMELLGTNDTKDYIVVQNFNPNNSTVRAYDLTGNKRIVVQPIAGAYHFLVPNYKDSLRKVVLTSNNQINNVEGLKPVLISGTRFTDYQTLAEQANDADYIIIAAQSLLNAAQTYAQYRNQTGYKSLVVNIEELYDQYAWGIPKHPYAIRALAEDMVLKWNLQPKFILLIGKSVNASVSRAPRFYSLNMLPTWGILGSDIAFTAGITANTQLEPEIPIGRIAARTNSQVLDYLDKVKMHESNPLAEWMKNVLHFGGGENSGEQATFKSYLKGYQATVEDIHFGGKVHTFLKNSTAPLQINLSDSVRNLINNGVSVMTFFGHAYGQNFDQSVDEPENYSNTGKYPLLIANSCLIGNIHTAATNSGSERFVLAKDKGTIGFLGSSSLGVTTYLNQYTSSFYRNFSRLNYGEPVGVLVQKTIKDIQNPLNELNRDVCWHMTLHGDPAVVLNAHELPDYTLYGAQGMSQLNVFTSPTEVTAEMDSFKINMIITNIGKAERDTLLVRVTRTFPNNSIVDTIVEVNLRNVYFKDTLLLTFPVDLLNGVGLNNLKIELDPLNQIAELDKFNNVANFPLLIASADVLPVFPYEYSVVNQVYPILKASTGNPFALEKVYVFEIDTSEHFTSPIKLNKSISSRGGVIEWNSSEDLSLKAFFDRFIQANSLATPNVYFWRVGVSKSNPAEIKWKATSFQYVNDKTGWGQAHWGQFAQNPLEFMRYQNTPRRFDFIEQFRQLEVTTHANGNLPFRDDIKYRLSGAIQSMSSSRWLNMLFVAVVDKKTLQPWHSQEYGNFGHDNYGRPGFVPAWNSYNFYFHMADGAKVDSLVSFINTVPDSNYIFMYNFLQHRLNTWYNSSSPVGIKLKNTMQALGSDVDSVATLPNNFPYIFFAQKGNPASAVDVLGQNNTDFIQLVKDLQNNWLDGSMFSTTIGPSNRFESLHWDTKSIENDGSDTTVLRLYGVQNNGLTTLLMDTIASNGDVFDLSMLNNQGFKELKLHYYFNDEVHRTPNLPIRWQVVHDEIPEVALNSLKLPELSFRDSVQQGDEIMLVVAIENISNVALNNYAVQYWVVDHQFKKVNPVIKPMGNILPGEVVLDTVFIPTENLQGLNAIWYEVNPKDVVLPWSMEKHHFNNVLLQSFMVGLDKINPMLDVAFDGLRILNGDIVSPSPEIVITLNDENPFLKLDDPTLIQLFVKYPTNQGDSTVLLSDDRYEFIPATLPKNEAKIIFKGNFPIDGMYELGILARDKSRNISGKGDGAYDLRLKFEVINESSITQLINYPNPFSTSTRFVFVLTGSELPDEIRIQILTISGKVVREINQDELGPLNIGRNITEFAWDGKDQFGDQLANGLYLYRVIVKSNGEAVKQRNQQINNNQINGNLRDQFFKNGLGKMYLLR